MNWYTVRIGDRQTKRQERSMPGPRVLVADDEPEVLAGLSRALERVGYEVHTAANGLEATSLLRRLRFDAVVADWKMPVIDGMNLLRFAKQNCGQIVFVLISAFATPDAVVEAMKCGSNHVLAKPFAPQEIVKVLRRELGNQRGIALPKASLETQQADEPM